jgi:hypothetical protein
MDRAIDTSRTIAIEGSTFDALLSLAISIVALLALGILTAFFVLFAITMGNTVFVFFSGVLAGGCALGAFVCLRRIRECATFLKVAGNVLTISPDGIRDRRVTEELVPWQAVKSVRTTPHEYASRMFGGFSPVQRTPLDVVLDIDPALTSQALKQQALIRSGAARMLGMQDPSQDTPQDTRSWITYTIELSRLKNITVNTLYDICQAYAAAHGKHAS